MLLLPPPLASARPPPSLPDQADARRAEMLRLRRDELAEEVERWAASVAHEETEQAELQAQVQVRSGGGGGRGVGVKGQGGEAIAAGMWCPFHPGRLEADQPSVCGLALRV